MRSVLPVVRGLRGRGDRDAPEEGAGRSHRPCGAAAGRGGRDRVRVRGEAVHAHGREEGDAREDHRRRRYYYY